MADTTQETNVDSQVTVWDVQEILSERGDRYKVRWVDVDPTTGERYPDEWVSKSGCSDELVRNWEEKKRIQQKEISKLRTDRRSSSVKTTAHNGASSSPSLGKSHPHRRRSSTRRDTSRDSSAPPIAPGSQSKQSPTRKRRAIVLDSSAESDSNFKLHESAPRVENGSPHIRSPKRLKVSNSPYSSTYAKSLVQTKRKAPFDDRDYEETEGSVYDRDTTPQLDENATSEIRSRRPHMSLNRHTSNDSKTKGKGRAKEVPTDDARSVGIAAGSESSPEPDFVFTTKAGPPRPRKPNIKPISGLLPVQNIASTSKKSAVAPIDDISMYTSTAPSQIRNHVPSISSVPRTPPLGKATKLRRSRSARSVGPVPDMSADEFRTYIHSMEEQPTSPIDEFTPSRNLKLLEQNSEVSSPTARSLNNARIAVGDNQEDSSQQPSSSHPPPSSSSALVGSSPSTHSSLPGNPMNSQEPSSQIHSDRSEFNNAFIAGTQSSAHETGMGPPLQNDPFFAPSTQASLGRAMQPPMSSEESHMDITSSDVVPETVANPSQISNPPPPAVQHQEHGSNKHLEADNQLKLRADENSIHSASAQNSTAADREAKLSALVTASDAHVKSLIVRLSAMTRQLTDSATENINLRRDVGLLRTSVDDLRVKNRALEMAGISSSRSFSQASIGKLAEKVASEHAPVELASGRVTQLVNGSHESVSRDINRVTPLGDVPHRPDTPSREISEQLSIARSRIEDIERTNQEPLKNQSEVFATLDTLRQQKDDFARAEVALRSTFQKELDKIRAHLIPQSAAESHSTDEPSPIPDTTPTSFATEFSSAIDEMLEQHRQALSRVSTLERAKENLQSDFDYLQVRYQDSSRAAADLGKENTRLLTENEKSSSQAQHGVKQAVLHYETIVSKLIEELEDAKVINKVLSEKGARTITGAVDSFAKDRQILEDELNSCKRELVSYEERCIELLDVNDDLPYMLEDIFERYADTLSLLSRLSPLELPLGVVSETSFSDIVDVVIAELEEFHKLKRSAGDQTHALTPSGVVDSKATKSMCTDTSGDGDTAAGADRGVGDGVYSWRDDSASMTASQSHEVYPCPTLLQPGLACPETFETLDAVRRHVLDSHLKLALYAPTQSQ